MENILQKKALGEVLYKQVITYHLDLVEVDYFGLQYMDANQVLLPFFHNTFFFLISHCQTCYIHAFDSYWICPTKVFERD